VDAAESIRRARLDAGLTQTQLAERLGTTQSAVARLERRGSNPRLATLDAIARATGARLELTSNPFVDGVDESMLVESLRMTPAERLAAHARARRLARRLAAAGPTLRRA
jgi:transcriptional regulator with XRE-family HTH domain